MTIDARTSVFKKTRCEVPDFVCSAFCPHGWEARQSADVGALLDSEPGNVWVAMRQGELAGIVGLRIHPEDSTREVHIVAGAPRHQKQGIGRALMTFAEERVRAAGMNMVMVKSVDGSGHEPARRAYEASDYERWPVRGTSCGSKNDRLSPD